MATQLPCPFVPSMSWGRSLEEVVPHLLHQGREIAKDTQMERSLRECSLQPEMAAEVAMATRFLAHQTMKEGDLKGCQGASLCQHSSGLPLRQAQEEGPHQVRDNPGSPFLQYLEGLLTIFQERTVPRQCSRM